MSWFPRLDDEWRENKQDPNIKRIKERARISLPNADIRIPSYTYLFEAKRLNLKKY